jgi:hypothetical protein
MAGSGLYAYRTCTDCAHRWTAPYVADDPTPGQLEADTDDEGREFYGEQPAAQGQVPSNMLLAVEYSIGHTTRTILVAPDANIVAIDGDLRISHTGPIHGIVAIRPTYVSQPAGEEQSA